MSLYLCNINYSESDIKLHDLLLMAEHFRDYTLLYEMFFMVIGSTTFKLTTIIKTSVCWFCGYYAFIQAYHFTVNTWVSERGVPNDLYRYITKVLIHYVRRTDSFLATHSSNESVHVILKKIRRDQEHIVVIRSGNAGSSLYAGTMATLETQHAPPILRDSKCNSTIALMHRGENKRLNRDLEKHLFSVYESENTIMAF